MKLLIVIVSLVALCNGFNLGNDAFVRTATAALKPLYADVKKQEATDNSILEYQSGNTVNVLGEISDFPHTLTTTAEIFDSIEAAVVSVFNLLASSVEDSQTSLSGGDFALPNALVVPYTTQYGVMENAFSEGVDCIQNMANIFSQQLVPYLSAISISSQGGMDVPSSAVIGIISNIQKIVKVTQTIANVFTDAATVSQKAESGLNLSLKASAVMHIINSSCAKFKSDTAGVVTSTNNYIANLPITAVSSETDRINGKVIFKDINALLSNLNSFMQGFNHNLKFFNGFVNILKNPIGGAFFNWL